MHKKLLTVALLREVFARQGDNEQFRAQLKEANRRGADLAILPELPYNAWSPATRQLNKDDAEGPAGWRETMQSEAARAAQISVLGGVIQQVGNNRFNRAIMSDRSGETIARYDKVHLPDEEGFREPCHYAPGLKPPVPFKHLGVRFGIQICSDANRPVGSHLLAAQGAQVILAPRASSPASWPQWRLAYQSIALTCGVWVISVGRPSPEFGVQIGGPALIVDPKGSVVVETVDSLSIHTIDAAESDRARDDYPGYLEWPADLYATGWKSWPSTTR